VVDARTWRAAPRSRCTEDIVQPAEWIEVGYHLLPDARGRGYATEAARALLGYGFRTLKLSEIHAVALPHNAPSQAVMQRLNMPWASISTTTWRLICFG
jgi:RimJ/RimL family protein N-acetyltransferase